MAGVAKKTIGDRRTEQRERLILCAERIIATQGLATLRARELAKQMGCATGALYNLVADLDELVLLVAQRTSGDLDASLGAVSAADDEGVLLAWAETYLRFAEENRLRWRALFEFRLPPNTSLPQWFGDHQQTLFKRLEDRLASLVPTLGGPERKVKARVLFSAVHGIVAMGLEEKLVALPADTIKGELRAFVRAYLRGLRAGP